MGPGDDDHVQYNGGQDAAKKVDTYEDKNIGEGDGGVNEQNTGETVPGMQEGEEGKEEEYSNEWTAVKEDKLINLYRKSKHLWDKTVPGYKARNKLEIAQKAWTKELRTPCKQIL